MARETEDHRLSLLPSDRELLRELPEQLNLSMNKTVAVAVRELAERVRGEQTITLDEVDRARVVLRQNGGRVT